MLQGTGSGVGKSLLAAAFCRLARRRGIAVTPFKGQNMSNNAAVTAGGGEIGRAQALQARAAGLEPHVDMNPVLLKPLADTRSEVVRLGHTDRETTGPLAGRITADPPRWLQGEAGEGVAGYEIHHGRTRAAPEQRPWLADGPRGLGHARGRHWGCYLHGAFGSDRLRTAWLRSLGLPAGAEDCNGAVDGDLDRLADIVERDLDVDAVFADVLRRPQPGFRAPEPRDRSSAGRAAARRPSG